MKTNADFELDIISGTDLETLKKNRDLESQIEDLKYAELENAYIEKASNLQKEIDSLDTQSPKSNPIDLSSPTTPLSVEYYNTIISEKSKLLETKLEAIRLEQIKCAPHLHNDNLNLLPSVAEALKERGKC